MKRERGYNVDPKDEAFNLLFRFGGGYPVDDNTAHGRDCISQMGLAEHSPRVLYNALRDLRCQVFDSNRVETCCSGGDLIVRTYGEEPEQKPGDKLDWLMQPMLSLDRRFTTRVLCEPQTITKQLQNLSAVALMLLKELR